MLKYGVMYSDKLAPEQEDSYEFINNVGSSNSYSNDGSLDKNLTVNVNLNNLDFKNATKYKYLKPRVVLLFKPASSQFKYEEVAFLDRLETEKYFRYVIAAQKGTYMLKIANFQPLAK